MSKERIEDKSIFVPCPFFYHFVRVTLCAHHSCLSENPRSDGVVPEVWVCCGSLAAEDGRARVWFCAVQPRMFQSVQRDSLNGRQCTEEIHNDRIQGFGICAVWPRLAQICVFATVFALPKFCPLFLLLDHFRLLLLCLVCTCFQGRIVGCALCYCSRAGAWNTTLPQMHTPTHHRSSKSFTTRGDDGDHPHWLIPWTFCTGYCCLLLTQPWPST